MQSVTDICKYHFLCFVTIIRVKAISGHQIKRSNKKHRDLELRHVCLVQIFAKKNAKNDLKALLEAIKSVKKQNSENYGKSRNDMKVSIFDMFYVVTQPFFKLST